MGCCESSTPPSALQEIDAEKKPLTVVPTVLPPALMEPQTPQEVDPEKEPLIDVIIRKAKKENKKKYGENGPYDEINERNRYRKMSLEQVQQLRNLAALGVTMKY